MKQEKLIEIEEAYQRYLAANEGKNLAEGEIDFTKCMRLGQVEE